MRKALIRAALFIAILLVLDRAVFAWILHLRNESGYHEGIYLIYYPKWDAEIDFFGNSRTRHNYDMRVIENETKRTAYDFGIDGIGVQEAVFMIEEALRNGHHPKVIVLQTEPVCLVPVYGFFNLAPFREYLATEPTNTIRWAAQAPTLAQRVGEIADAWIFRSASFPNRVPDMWIHSNNPDVPPSPTVQPGVCGGGPCFLYHGSELYRNTHSYAGTPVPPPISVVIDPKKTELYRDAVKLATDYGAYLLLVESPRYFGDTVYSAEARAQVDEFYCGLAQANPNVMYARLSHVGGRNPDIYLDEEHFNVDGARLMSEAVAPLIAELADNHRPQPCLLR